MRSCRTPRTPPGSEKEQRCIESNDHFNEQSSAFADLPMTPGQKRLRERDTPPGDKPVDKKRLVLTPNNLEINGSSLGLPLNNAWSASAPSFAEVLKGPSQFQVAIKSEPLRQFSAEDRLDFIDAVGDKIFEASDVLPHFESTTLKGDFIIVTANDQFSFDWLISKVPEINIWDGFCLIAFPADEIPKIKKALLWLPGRKTVSAAEALCRLEKANPSLGCKNWRVFSKKVETYGCRLLIGLEEIWLEALTALEMKPYWSTVRAQVTLVEEVKKRRRRSQPARRNKANKITIDIDSEAPIETISPLPEEADIYTGPISAADVPQAAHVEEDALPISAETDKIKTVKPARKGKGSSRKNANKIRQMNEDKVSESNAGSPSTSCAKSKTSFLQGKLSFSQDPNYWRKRANTGAPSSKEIDVVGGGVNLPISRNQN